jgi:hypothetical protein
MTHQGLNDTVQWQNDWKKSGGIQPTRPEAPELKQRRLEQNRLEQSRQEQRRRLRQIRAPAYALVEEVNEVERRLSPFRSMFDQLVFEYCHLKYSPLATNISQTEQETRLLTSYAVAILERSRSAYVRQRRELRRRIMDMIEHLVAISGRQKLVEIVRLKNELFAPTISARRRVDAALDVHYAWEDGHDDLFRSINAVTTGFLGFRKELIILGEMLGHSTSFKKRSQKRSRRLLRECLKGHFAVFNRGQMKFMEAAHRYRTYVHQSKLSMSQFAEAWPFRLNLGPGERKHINHYIAMRRRSGSELKHANDSRKGGPAPGNELDCLKEFYFPQSESQRSHLLDLHRRQLDVMAPVFLVDVGMLALKKEAISCMSTVLGKVRESKLSNAHFWWHRERFRAFVVEFNDRRAIFKSAYLAVAHTNWLRLKAEARLHRLGGWSANDQKSLVVSKPISRTLVLFRGWVRKLKDYENTYLSDTVDPEDLVDEELDGNPLLPNLGSDSNRHSISTQWESSTGDTQAALSCGWFERKAKLEGERAKAEPATHHGPRQSTESQPRQGDGRDPPIQGRNARARSVQRHVMQHKTPRPSTDTKHIDPRMPKFKQLTVSGCSQKQAP